MKCIGCDKKGKKCLCKKCEETLTYLEQILNRENISLELESVIIK